MKKINLFSRNKIRLYILILGLFIIDGHLYIAYYPQIARIFKNIPFPVLNCYSVPTTIWACPVGTFQHFLVIGSFTFLTLGVVILTGAILGRWTCGWLCPFGFIQEVLHFVPFKKFNFPKWAGYSKHVIFIVLVVVLPIIYKETFFCMTCPAGGLGAGIPHVFMDPALQNLLGVLFWSKMLFLALIIIGSMFVRRPFCSLVCPLGLGLGTFNSISFLKLKFNESKCYHCNICKVECPMGIDPTTDYNSIDCIRCMNCTKQRCNALTYEFSISDKKKKEK